MRIEIGNDSLTYCTLMCWRWTTLRHVATAPMSKGVAHGIVCEALKNVGFEVD